MKERSLSVSAFTSQSHISAFNIFLSGEHDSKVIGLFFSGIVGFLSLIWLVLLLLWIRYSYRLYRLNSHLAVSLSTASIRNPSGVSSRQFYNSCSRIFNISNAPAGLSPFLLATVCFLAP